VSFADAVKGAETALSVAKVLAPIAEKVVNWFEGGSEPPELLAMPAELRSVAALERARYRARMGHVE
jgi:hypothetical protein